MSTFREEIRRRNWVAKTTATHFLMDSGKLNVPDEQAGAFLNTYFTFACVKHERLSVVELKTPVFRLFFDIDGKFPSRKKTECMATLRRIVLKIQEYTRQFFDESVDCTAIACFAPPKPDKDGDEKHGIHIIFPNCIVNSPIASCCRDGLIPWLDDAFRATSSTWILPLNSWQDVVDDSVFKANGLRMIWSNKGKTETRPYEPNFRVNHDGVVTEYTFNNVLEKRDAIRETSIRVFNATVSKCRMGEHNLSSTETTQRDSTPGTSTSIDMYGSVLPDIRAVLPAVYKDVVFTAAFVTTRAVMLKTTSTYCQNKGDHHRTSTVYFCITRHGVSQRCYSRKEGNGCDRYASETIKLPERIIRVFFPGFIPDDDDIRSHVRQPTKRRLTNIDTVLKRTRLLKKTGPTTTTKRRPVPG